MAAILYDDRSRQGVWSAPTGTLGDGGVDRLSDPQPRHRCRLTDAATETLICDLQAPASVDCFALISTNLTAATSVRVRASSSDPAALTGLVYDSTALTGVTDDRWLGQVVLTAPAPVTARYVRWDFADAALGPVEIGLAPIGLLFRPAVNFAYGAEYGRFDYATREINAKTGAVFSVTGPQARAISATFDALTEAEVRGDFLEMDRICGASGDVLFVPDAGATPLVKARDSVWGGFRQPGYGAARHDSFAHLSRGFQFLERL